MRWLFARRDADGLSSLRDEAAEASSPKASIPREEVGPMSPATLLARSLTAPETRDEWAAKEQVAHVPGSTGMILVNKARDLSVTRYWTGFSSGLITPFSLSKAEEKIVTDALAERSRWQSEERQKAALARLIAPAKAIEARSGETAKPVRSERRKRGPKASPNPSHHQS